MEKKSTKLIKDNLKMFIKSIEMDVKNDNVKLAFNKGNITATKKLIEIIKEGYCKNWRQDYIAHLLLKVIEQENLDTVETINFVADIIGVFELDMDELIECLKNSEVE